MTSCTTFIKTAENETLQLIGKTTKEGRFDTTIYGGGIRYLPQYTRYFQDRKKT